MDFATSRRVATTYGRPAKRVLVHNLFEHRDGASIISKHVSRDLPSVPATHDDLRGREVPALDSTGRKLYGRAFRPQILSPVRSSDSDNASTKNAHADPDKDVDLFDIRSSEDDEKETRSKPAARKRRKMVQVSRTQTTQPKEQGTKLAQRSENAPVPTRKAEKKLRQQLVSQKHDGLVSAHPTIQLSNSKTVTLGPVVVKMKPSKPSKPRPAPLAKAPPKVPPQPFTEDLLLVDDFTGTDASDHLTDCSSRSVRSQSGTPKRKRSEIQSNEDNVPSPSQLEITSLRLTPEKSAISPSGLTSPGHTSDDGGTPRRVRPRLIDRLDGPVQTEQITSDSNGRGARKSEQMKTPEAQRRMRGRVRIQRQDGSTQSTSHPTVERSQSSQSRATYATKARTTYAKERSHLSDMVDSLDSLGASSSQHSSQGLLIQATTSNLASSLDFEEDESDGEAAIKKLKSIHELRQAGAMSRFDREVQTLLEDVEVTDPVKKPLRLRALMKLTERLGDESFLRYFVGSGRTARLTTCSTPSLDLTSTVLLATALHILSKAETSLETMTDIFHSAVELAPKMLKTPKTLSQLVQVPTGKLSKSTVKDLIAFEEYLVDNEALPMSADFKIHPDSLVLTCLDEVLRSIIRVGNHSAKMSVSCYTEILHLLERHARAVTVEIDGSFDPPTVEKALSLLEVCSMVFDNLEYDVPANEYRTLGDSLATIMHSTTDDQATLPQSILKAVVSLSNSKPKMCHLLGQSSITDAVFFIIDANFVTVADLAEHEQTIDQRKLDSVILALGCLLNFSECDGETRKKIAQNPTGRYTYLHRLVAIFNSQVDKAQEVTTAEQSQVLVAFGYLSMLLCTMSLDPKVRTQITELLKDKSFEELCAAAETFFSHLRTLENISDGDASMSAFTARFSAILATIRSMSVLEG